LSPISTALVSRSNGIPSTTTYIGTSRIASISDSRPTRNKSDLAWSTLFLVGLLSLMDAILEVPMYVVVDGIPLDRETRAVLMGDKSQLSPVYQLVIAQEDAEWQKVTSLSAQLHLPEDFVAESHWNAMQWAHEMTGMA